jgi:HAD superfamily hydrolase (TIGR01509 family)
MIRAILMDFNGVIINDERIQMAVYQDIFKDEGFEMNEADYLECFGMDDEAFIKHQFKRAKQKITNKKVEELRAKKIAGWRKSVEKEIPLCDGVENFIKKCSNRFAMGIVSMNNREEIEYVLEKTGLRKHFTKIVAAGEVAEHKPSPQVYWECFKELDRRRTAQGRHPLVHRECVVIEDAPQGIKGAKAAGMQTLGITSTFGADVLREAGADAVSDTLTDWMPDSMIRVFSKIA